MAAFEGDPIDLLRPPETSPTGIVWWVVSIILAIALWVLVEVWLRHRRRRLRAIQAWQAFERIAREKELSEDEMRLLRLVIKQRLPDDPLRALTTRQYFEACVTAFMDSVLARGDEGQFAEMGLVMRGIRMQLGLDYVPLGQHIYSTRGLMVGQAVWLTKKSEGRAYRGVVSETDDAYFRVDSPSEGELTRLFESGEAVRGHVWREDDARYNFSATVMKATGDPPALVFRHTGAMSRVQDRSNYRVRLDQSTSVAILSAPSRAETPDAAVPRILARMSGRVTNLSAGGLAVVVEQAMPRQALLRVGVTLNDREWVEVEARAVAMTPLAGGRTLVRASFVGIDEEEREQIARYVLERQKRVLSEAAGGWSEG